MLKLFTYLNSFTARRFNIILIYHAWLHILQTLRYTLQNTLTCINRVWPDFSIQVYVIANIRGL